MGYVGDAESVIARWRGPAPSNDVLGQMPMSNPVMRAPGISAVDRRVVSGQDVSL